MPLEGLFSSKFVRPNKLFDDIFNVYLIAMGRGGTGCENTCGCAGRMERVKLINKCGTHGLEKTLTCASLVGMYTILDVSQYPIS